MNLHYKSTSNSFWYKVGENTLFIYKWYQLSCLTLISRLLSSEILRMSSRQLYSPLRVDICVLCPFLVLRRQIGLQSNLNCHRPLRNVNVGSCCHKAQDFHMKVRMAAEKNGTIREVFQKKIINTGGGGKTGSFSHQKKIAKLHFRQFRVI